MTTTTSNQGIIIPVGTDAANNPNAFVDMIGGVEGRLAMRFTNLADRTARLPAPIENQVSGLATENRVDAFDSAAWVSLAARGLHTRAMRTTNATAINASIVLVPDAVLIAALDVLGTYTFRGRIYYDSATAADIRLAFTWPASSAAKWGLYGREAATQTNFSALVATASAAPLIMGGNAVGTNTFMDFDGFVTITATGALQASYAQGTSDVSNTTVQSGSYLEVMKTN